MELLTSIEDYWDKRAPSYTDVILKNLEGTWQDVWAEALMSHFPKGEHLKVLDVGTGPGFYAIILAKRGCNVTAVDYSEGMLEEAKRNAGDLKDAITFARMDAQNLEFPDESFDVVVSRNLTWNLPDPERAYRQWHRVLRKGGVMLNFDANWYAYLFDEEKKKEFDACRENTRTAGVEDHESYAESDRMEEITRHLPMGRIHRPKWDLEVLEKIGFAKASADEKAGEVLWNPEEKINYASTPGFLIYAEK